MNQLARRQDFTPDGQELPPWLAYEDVTTTVDGAVITTGVIVQLPQTYYGPSIPLGDGWVYGGSVSPTESALQPSDSRAPTASPTDTGDSETTSSDEASATSTSDQIDPDPTTSTPASSSPGSGSTSIISISSSSLTPTSSQNPPSSDTPSPSPPTNGFTITTDSLPNLTVLIPSLIGSLLVAVLLLLLVICYRRRGDYRRAGTTEPDDRTAATAADKDSRGRGKVLGGGARLEGYTKVSTGDPADGLLADGASSGVGVEAARGAGAGRPRPANLASKEDRYAPLTAHLTPPAAQATRTYPDGVIETNSTDITDRDENHSQSQGILSRLSAGLGLGFGLGLGAPPRPSGRQMSNGTAEKAMRMPSWAQVADIGTAVRRHVSSSTFGRVISRASGYGPVPGGGTVAGGPAGYGGGVAEGYADAWAGDIGMGGMSGSDEKPGYGPGVASGAGGGVQAGAATAIAAGSVSSKRTPEEEKRDAHVPDVKGTPATSHATPGSHSTTVPPSHSISNTRSMGESELFYAPPPSASTWIHGFFRSRSSRETSDSNSNLSRSGRGGGSEGSHSHSQGSGRSSAPTHASTSGSNFSSARTNWSDESRGTVVTRDSRTGALSGAGGWRARARAFAGDDFGVRTRGPHSSNESGGEEGAMSNAALPLGAHDVLPAYTSSDTSKRHDPTGDGLLTGIGAIGGHDDTLRARRHAPPAEGITRARHDEDPDHTHSVGGDGHVRTVSVGIPYTPASRVASVPSFHSTDSGGAPVDSPTRWHASEGQTHAHDSRQLRQTGYTGAHDGSVQQGLGQSRGRSRFPSYGGERLEFPLPPATSWNGLGASGEVDSLLAESEYHSARSNVSSRQPSRQPSRDRETPRQTPDAPTVQTSPAFGVRSDTPVQSANSNSNTRGTVRRAFGLSHLFRSSASSAIVSPVAASSPVAIHPAPRSPGPGSIAPAGTSGTSARTRSFESRYSYAPTSAPNSAGLEGSVEGPLSSRAMRAARPLSAIAPSVPGLAAISAGQEGGVKSAGDDETQARPGPRMGGVAGPKLRMVSRSTVGREQQWGEFGQLQDRRPSNILPPVSRHSHIGSIHISDSAPSVYSWGTSSSGANSSHIGMESGSIAPSSNSDQAGVTGPGRTAKRGRADGSDGASIDGGSVGSGVSKGSKVSKTSKTSHVSQISQGVPDRALRGRRSAATLVRSSSLKSTATSHATPQLSSSASTPINALPGQLPQVLQPVTPVHSAPVRGRMERVPRLGALSSASPSPMHRLDK